MKTSTLSRRSLRYYWRNGVSVLAGTALAASVLIGALLVGDSVRFSLRRFALQRLGTIHFALDSRRRFFRDDLASRIAGRAASPVTAALRLRGVALTDDLQANRVNVLGVKPDFWSFARAGAAGPDIGRGEAAVNRRLAHHLGVGEGDEISLRVEVPSLLPRDAPLASRGDDTSTRLRLTVGRVVDDDMLGRFGLAAEQVAPFNAFIDRALLQSRTGLDGRSNLLLAGRAAAGPLTAADLQACLSDCWKLEDGALRLREIPQSASVQLETERVFFDPVTSAALLDIEGAVGTLSYLVNAVIATDGEGRQTPYSFVTGCEAGRRNQGLSPVPANLEDNEMMINGWLADHLQVEAGNRLRVTYYELTSANDFVERARHFRVRRVVDMDDIRAERDRMPKFPGLSDVEDCSDWNVGMPMDEDMLADEANEAYWDRYRETPKAFITLAAAQDMWANRFGDLTAVRFSLETRSADDIRAAVTRAVDPAGLGLFFMPVREEALDAVSRSMDFGGLFLGMSVFLIAAALLLTGLLFVFGLQQRSGEIGTLLALGFPVGRVRRLFIREAAVVAAVGTAVGAWAGTFYTQALIWALGRYWQGAVAGAAIVYHGRWETVVRGSVISFAMAMLAVSVTMWRLCRRPARELLAEDFTQNAPSRALSRHRLLWLGGASALALVALAVVVAGAAAGARHTLISFFGGGALLLLAGLGFCRAGLGMLAARETDRVTIRGIGLRNSARRAGRSTAVVTLLAGGCFMVLAVSSMQEDVTAHADKRWSGTGGFALFAQSTLPIPENLGRAEAREPYGLDREPVLDDVSMVALRVYEAEDASCFNLNRVTTPRLYGVNPSELASREAFLPRDGGQELWQLLKRPLPDGAIPGLVGDLDTAMWGLDKRVGPDGDVITYRDDSGRLFNVRLVGKLPMRLSVFQGSVLIAADAFTEQFPSVEGFRAFLVDAPPGQIEAVRRALSRRLSRFGVDLVPTAERLRAFYSVESTYLKMFLVLGGMGLLLGSAGMGLIVMRNVMERRNELAILQAVGYRRGTIRNLLLAEHWFLVGLGMAVGLLASGVAMWPSLRSVATDVPVGMMLLILGGVVVFGLVCTLVSTLAATRGSLTKALRNE